MDKGTLLRYIKGELSPEEERIVLEWICSDSGNMRYFSDLKNLWVKENMPGGYATDEEMEKFWKKLDSGTGMQKIPYYGTTGVRKRRFGWIVYAAAAVLIIALFLNVVIFRNYLLSDFTVGEENREIIAFADADSSIRTSWERMAPRRNVYVNSPGQAIMRTLYTEKGVKARIVLPDSSCVWLNSDSELEYPDRFEGGEREVKLNGEGYFIVKQDSLNPMIVRTDKGFYIKVLGTEFNLKCYDNDNEYKAVLYTGKINLVAHSARDNKDVEAEIRPLESFMIKKESENRLVVKKEAGKETDAKWKDGYLIFEEEPMSEVLKKIERWHGAKFIVKDAAVYDNRINANFKEESLVQIMELISLCTNISYQIEGNCVTLGIKK